MEEFALYALALGASAVFIVPILAKIIVSILPASMSTYLSGLPQSYPEGMAAVWAVVAWGVALAGALYLVSMIKPVGRAVRAGGR